MEVPLKYYFTRDEIGRAVVLGLSELLIGNITRYLNTETKQYSLGVILCVMGGKPMKFADGTITNVHLRCEQFEDSGETKICRISITQVSNKEPCSTDVGFEFAHVIRAHMDYFESVFINRMVNEWLKEIEKEWMLDPESRCSSYSDD